MLRYKTHFEQVPLEVVKKIVAGQLDKGELPERYAKQKDLKTLIDDSETN
jgi:hypothetical protein